MGRSIDRRFATRMRELLARRDMSYRALAARTFYGKSYLHELATGGKAPSADAAARIDNALGAGGELLACVVGAPGVRPDDELDALELARRVDATDISVETLTRLEAVVDELAMAYATVPPEQLLPRLRRHLSYMARLIDARATVAQQKRLLAAGGWLSLITATVHLDLSQQAAADARLATAAQLSDHAEHQELQAWCVETRAWNALVDGDYPRALDLSQQAQAIAPRGSSAFIQATAQEGRAWARMAKAAETRRSLARVERLVGPLSPPEHPEHHYQYDPSKALAYTATTLAWVADPAAVNYARSVVAHMQAGGVEGVPRPRRVTLARLDLALALLGTGRPDEAGAEATVAISSGHLVPSTWWRATEVLHGVERAGIGEAEELREVYEAFRPGGRNL